MFTGQQVWKLTKMLGFSLHGSNSHFATIAIAANNRPINLLFANH